MTGEASSSAARPAAVPSTEPTIGCSSVENLTLKADEGGNPADVQEPVNVLDSAKTRKNKKRKERRRAKKSGESSHAVPSQSQTELPDGAGHVEDVERTEELGGSQTPSNTTPHAPEPVETD